MASLSVSVPHQLGQQAALARVREFLESVRRDYAGQMSDVEGQWDDNRLQFGFRASGLTISGNMVVEESQVHVNAPLPLAAAFFRGRIENAIRDELQRLLSG
jgi:hypothetical protein